MALTTVKNAGLAGSIDLTAKVTGTLPIANGGTNSTSTTFVNAASNVTGTLPIANGGTAATTFAAAGLVNTPAFNVYNNAAQSLPSATATELVWNVENIDSDGKFASNRFTPTVAGSYLIHAQIVVENLDSGNQCRISFRKNGSQITGPYPQTEMFTYGTNQVVYSMVTQIITFNTTDYVSAFGYQNEGSSQNSLASINMFWGYKLIGV
jgi:hypothetical protein